VSEFVDAFLKLASREYFWLDIVSSNLDDELNKINNLPLFFDIESIRGFAKVFCALLILEVDLHLPIQVAFRL